MPITPEQRLARMVIDNLGGTTATAAICGIKKGSVSEWRQTGLPQAREQFLRLRSPEAFTARKVVKKKTAA